MMTVLLLDPQPRFLHRVSDEFGQTAQAYGQECRVVSVESSEAALKELGRQSLSHWDMFLVNQDYLQNGLPSPVVPSPLVEALRDRFAEIPVTILSVDRIAEADQTYKGLRMPLTGRPGYTTYVFPQSAFKAPNGNGGAAWPGVEVAETTCGDVFDIIRARKHVAAMLNHKGWLEELVSHGDIDVGISVVDCTYRLQYVNQQQRRISCRPDIQVGGICWMEYNPGFSQVHRCPWCPVAKARAARRARSSTTISPSVCPHAVAPGRQDLANLALPAYRFYDVRAVPVPDPEEPGASGRSRPSSATMFVLGDFRSPPSLLKNLRNPEPLATYLWDRFSDTARQTLSDPDTSEEALSQTLLEQLNTILDGDPIYEERRFTNVKLSDGTRRLLQTRGPVEPALQVNRRLLEDAFPSVLLPRPIATLELVTDCTEGMLQSCRSAILDGRENFRDAIERMLQRICDLGFDRARFWILNQDPHYLDGFVCFPRDKHAPGIATTRLVEHTDYYLRLAKQQRTPFYCTGKEGTQAPETARFRDPETPWIEVPLWARKEGHDVFVGKINLDNEPSLKSVTDPAEADLHRNEVFWPLLEKYAEMLGALILEASEHWLREERARQAEELRALDLRLVEAPNLGSAMRAVADCAERLLRPDQCHIRFRQGDVLSLMALAGKGLEARLRDTVSVQQDKEVSVSAAFINNGRWDQPFIFGPADLAVIAVNLRNLGRTATATQFESLKCCGVFGLLGPEKELIGVLVVDSKAEHYFDRERISVAKDVVARAQIVLAHNLAHQRLQNLINSLDSEVAVLDRNARVLLNNQAWSSRAGKVSPKPEQGPEAFSSVAGCSQRDSSLFQREVVSVFAQPKPTRLVAAFDGGGGSGKTRHMAVMLAPFECNRLGGVESVLLVMSDITGLVSVESIIQSAAPKADVGQALVEPLKGIVRLFDAARATVLECVCFGFEDSAIRVRCRVHDSGAVETAPRQLPVIADSGQLLSDGLRDGYLAVTDLNSSENLRNEDFRRMLLQGGIQSLLAAPIYLSGEAWGVLTVSFKHQRTFSGEDVHLLRAAASQLSVLVLLSQQAELRSMDREIAAGMGSPGKPGAERLERRDLFQSILRQATRLTSAQGGHIRVADWERRELVLQAAENDPLVQPGKPPVRERVRVGEPVAGIVVLNGEPVIKHRRSDFNPARLEGIPPDRTDVLAALAKEESFACVPLIAGQEILGTATLTSDTPRLFDGRRRQLLDDFIQRASLALSAVRQMERLEQMSREFDKEMDVPSLEALWPKIAELAKRLFLCEVASISSFNVATNELRREAAAVMAGYNYQEPIGETIAASDELGCGLSRWVAKVGGVYPLEGAAAFNHPHLSTAGPGYHDRLPSRRLKSIMLARLDTPEDKPTGVLRVINRKGRMGDLGFTEFDELLMRLLSTKLAIAIERLKLMESRNRSIATTAHDLKTPLQNIRVTLDGFLEGAFRLPDNAEELRMSYNSCKLLDAFILSTIEVAQGKMDRARVQVEEIDARMLVNEAIEVLRPKFNDPRAKDNPWNVVTTVALGAEKVWGDRQQLLRLLLNLCHNAWKHGRATNEGLENGTQRNQVEITVQCDGDACCLRVADHGPGLVGIAARGHATVASGQEDRGHGVGLASATLIAEAHQGKLTCGGRADRLSGFQVEVVWNQMELRQSLTLAQSMNKKRTEQ